MFADNKALGQFELVGIPPAPRGMPQIEVTFDIDANGILSVTAKDMGTLKEQSMRITAPNKLDNAEVERMRKDAETHADTDKKRKDDIETVNHADTLVYQTETQLKDFKGKVPQPEIDAIEAIVVELRQLLAAPNRDVARIKQVSDECTQAMHKAAEALYAKAQAAPGAKGAKGGKKPAGAEGETIDGEKA